MSNKSDQIVKFVNDLKAQDETRDSILLQLAIKFQMSPGESTKFFSKHEIVFRTLGYREWTAKAFIENPELTLEEWQAGVGEFLTSTKNYNQLFPLFAALANKKELD